jgi:hypothetical protein
MINLTTERTNKLFEMLEYAYKKNHVNDWIVKRHDWIINNWFELCIMQLPIIILQHKIAMIGISYLHHHQLKMISGEIDKTTKEPIHPIDYLFNIYTKKNLS